LSEQTRQVIDNYLKAANKRPGEFLFTGRRGANAGMTTRQYARLVEKRSRASESVVLRIPSSSFPFF
jgi:hypothetical protein